MVPAITSHLQQPSEAQTGGKLAALRRLLVTRTNRQFCRNFWWPPMKCKVSVEETAPRTLTHCSPAWSQLINRPAAEGGSNICQWLRPLRTGPRRRQAEGWRKQSNVAAVEPYTAGSRVTADRPRGVMKEWKRRRGGKTNKSCAVSSSLGALVVGHGRAAYETLADLYFNDLQFCCGGSPSLKMTEKDRQDEK